MLQYTIGHLPSEHLHVWATCTTGHLHYWATFNCAIKIRNHHIIRCVYGAIRTYSIDIMSTADVNERVTAFANYIVDTYVDHPPHLWASEPDADDYVPRTTNAAESFHAHIKQLFTSPGPNLYLFAFKLLQLQEETCVNLPSLHFTRTLPSNQLERANYDFKHLPIDSSDTDT